MKAGTYAIPVKAATNATSAEAELEAVITGTHELKLTTPSERLNAKVTAGGKETIELEIKNTGSAPVADIELSAEAPAKWSVKFEHEKITHLAAVDRTHRLDSGLFRPVVRIVYAARDTVEVNGEELSFTATLTGGNTPSIIGP